MKIENGFSKTVSEPSRYIQAPLLNPDEIVDSVFLTSTLEMPNISFIKDSSDSYFSEQRPSALVNSNYGASSQFHDPSEHRIFKEKVE